MRDAVLDALDDAVLLEDATGRLVHVNRVFLDWFGPVNTHAELAAVFDDFQADLEPRAVLEHRDGRVFERRYTPGDPRVWVYRRSEPRVERDLLAQLGHELRTPLNATIGLTELALDTDLDPRARTWLTRALANAEATLELVTDLLDWSRIEAGQMVLSVRSFRPDTIVQQVVEAQLPRAHGKGLTVRFDPIEMPRVRGDAARWRQIVTNLVSNAIKYTDEGAVDVQLESIERTDRVGLSLVVRDTGIGIADRDRERIFQRFFRANHTSSGRMSGSGLGLAITRSLVELMDGRISLVSELGVGTTFTVQIVLGRDTAGPDIVVGTPHPSALDAGLEAEVVGSGRGVLERCLARPPAVVVLDEHLVGPDAHTLAGLLRQSPGLESCRIVGLRHTPGWRVPGLDAVVDPPVTPDSLRQAMQRPPSPTGARVLVVDDAPDGREVLLEVLRRSGHRPVPAEDGLEAVVLASRQTFDLVLMDLDMPHVDGIQATARIRDEERRTGRPPVRIVALTAHDTPAIRARCEAAGMDGFHTKPVSRSLLDTLLGTPTRDVSDLADLLPLFHSEREKDLHRIDDALAQGDLARLASVGHRMKGAAATLGVAEVESLAEALRQAALTRDLAALHHAAERLREWLASV